MMSLTVTSISHWHQTVTDPPNLQANLVLGHSENLREAKAHAAKLGLPLAVAIGWGRNIDEVFVKLNRGRPELINLLSIAPLLPWCPDLDSHQTLSAQTDSHVLTSSFGRKISPSSAATSEMYSLKLRLISSTGSLADAGERLSSPFELAGPSESGISGTPCVIMCFITSSGARACKLGT